MLEFNPEFFEEEVRDEFTVPSFMKNAWAAELEMLDKVDRICRENDIQYFANWGTLLGAVRHKGIIPWDDDIDLCMKRADLEKFSEVVENYEDIEIHTNFNASDHGMHAARVMNSTMYTVDRERYKKFHGFPFPAGLDVFYLDYVPRDKALEEEQVEVLRKTSEVVHIMEWLEENDPSTQGYEQMEKKRRQIVRWLEYTCQMNFSELNPTEQEILILSQEVQGLYGDEDSDYLTEFACLGVGMDYYIPKEAYGEAIRMPFENTTIPVPVGYDLLLRKKYGDDYMTPRIYVPGHDYPFYKIFVEAIYDKNKHESIEGALKYVENTSGKFYREFLNKSSEPRIKYSEKELQDDLARKNAAECELLDEVKRLCDMSNTTLFALDDTLVGAVENSGQCVDSEGIHLGIKREELNSFLLTLPQELDPWFNYGSLYSTDNYEDMRIQIYNDGFMCDKEEFAKRFHGCNDKVVAYISIIDTISDDDEKENVRKTLIENLIFTSKSMPSQPPYSDEVLGIVEEWQKITSITINVEANIKREFLRAADYVGGSYRDDNAKRVRITARLQEGEDVLYEKNDFSDVVTMPFGNTTINVPSGYKNIMKQE